MVEIAPLDVVIKFDLGGLGGVGSAFVDESINVIKGASSLRILSGHDGVFPKNLS